MIIGLACGSNISFLVVFIISVLWELVESIAGYYDIRCCARTTDVFVNMLGFACGKYWNKH